MSCEAAVEDQRNGVQVRESGVQVRRAGPRTLDCMQTDGENPPTARVWEADMKFAVPYVGSFQRGRIHRTGDPLSNVWRSIERMGTVDNLARIAGNRGHATRMALDASVRIRQAVELRKASRGATALTRPLLLYYSALNLSRGAMMILSGHMGSPTHGVRYEGSDSWLLCSAKVTKKGTFVELSHLLGMNLDCFIHRSFSLGDALGQIPELLSDFHLLNAGSPSVAFVKVEAVIGGPMTLRFLIDGLTEDDFREQWTTLFPWFKELCDLGDAAFTLNVRNRPENEESIARFCKDYLLNDLNWRDNAIWYDHMSRENILLMPRLSAYLGALFILSNICRYDPQKIDSVARDPTDAAYVLNTFLDHVERYFPQVVLETLNGTGMYFT